MPGTTVMALNSERWPPRLFLFCFSCAVALVLMDVFLNYGKALDSVPLRRVFNITREDGLATWFMVVQTACAGLVLALIAVVSRSRGNSASKTAGWGLLSLFFFYLSADDGAEIHERLGSTFKAAARDAEAGTTLVEAQGWFPSYDWQLVVLPFFAVAGVLMLLFLLREFRTPQKRAVLFVAPVVMALAVGLDFFEGLDDAHPLNVHSALQERYDLTSYTVSHFSKAAEEFLEMCSIALLLALFVQHLLEKAGPGIALGVQEAPE